MKKLYSGAEKLGLNLTPEQLQKFEVYYQGLVEWNKRVNLTSVTGYEEVQITHFLDSLTVISGFPSPQPRPATECYRRWHGCRIAGNTPAYRIAGDTTCIARSYC
jgi:hypothetical protein